MTTKAPPYIALSWTATALTTNFGGYNVYRRVSRTPALPWTLIAYCSVPSGYTPANVEAQHNAFNDFEAGWAITGGQWGDGFDYAVTVISTLTKLESALSTVVARVQQTADTNPWVCCNSQPYLSFPIASLQQLDVADEGAMTEYRLSGRDMAVTRTQLELPPRKWTIGYRVFSRLGEDPARVWRAAAASGLPFAIQDPRGDRLIGVLETPTSLPHEDVGVWTLTGTATEVDRNLSLVADYNVPAALVFNGSSQLASVADNALLKPAGVPFTYFAAGIFVTTANAYHLAKIGAGQGFGLLNDGAGKMAMQVNGAGGSGTVSDAANAYNDAIHSVIVTAATGAQVLYRDGVQVQTSAVGYTTITSTDILTIGAKSNVTAFSADAINVYGYYPRTLTASEITNLDLYCRGVPGVRAPSGAVLFIDLRDLRSWDGTQSTATVSDLSGNSLTATLIGSPATRGIPANRAQVDRF